MKEYYYLEEKVQKGPFNIEELQTKKLNSQTYIWTEGMADWTVISNLPELSELLNAKKNPPPTPLINRIANENSFKSTSNSNDLYLKQLRPTKRTFIIFIIWCSFHLFALITSYSQIPIFNSSGYSSTSDFWPFVSFTHVEMDRDPTGKQDTIDEGIHKITIDDTAFNNRMSRQLKSINPQHNSTTGTFADLVDSSENDHYTTEPVYVRVNVFNGIFNNYDWTEFIVYVGGFIIIYMLVILMSEPVKKREF